MEIDDVHARELNSKRVKAKSHSWQSWEDLFALKSAIETSGYKTRKDMDGVITAMEGLQMKNSLSHPQGDKTIRKEKHADSARSVGDEDLSTATRLFSEREVR